MARHLFPKLLPVKSLQRGRTSLVQNQTVDVTINEVDLNYTVLITQRGARNGLRAFLTSPTNLRIINVNAYSYTYYFNWNVIEFYNNIHLSAGGSSHYPENLGGVKSVQHIAATMPEGSLTGDNTINSVNVEKSVVIYNGVSTSSYDVDAYLLDSQTLRLDRATAYTYVLTCNVCVIEFY